MNDVIRYREGRPVHASSKAGPWHRTISFVRRHRVGLGAALLAVSATVAFGVVSAERARALSDQRLSAQNHRAEAKRTNKPIFLLAARPECRGVPGFW